MLTRSSAPFHRGKGRGAGSLLAAGQQPHRVEQGNGIVWFLQLARRAAPTLEFFCLPKMSVFPLLMRRRRSGASSGDDPFSGNWTALQLRSTNFLQAAAGSNSRSGSSISSTTSNSDLLCRLKNPSFYRFPHIPVVITSVATNSLCVLAPHETSVYLNIRTSSHDFLNLDDPGAEQTLASCLIDLCDEQTAAHLQGQLRGKEICPVRGTCASTRLLDMIEASAATPGFHRNRQALIQAMKRPVFRDLRFDPEFPGGAYNATLRGHRVLFRASSWYARGAKSERIYSGRIHFHKHKTELDGTIRRMPYEDTDDVDIFLFLVADDPSDTSKVTRIGLVPKKAMLESGHLRCHGSGGRVFLRVRCSDGPQEKIIGRNFGGLGSYFVSQAADDETVSTFAERILCEVSADTSNSAEDRLVAARERLDERVVYPPEAATSAGLTS
ncbi:unnamed protein product [Amoebophrya sp. A120]|nr:unnamed protein product [Amoebophrya sp. A120]|eukprot:GSA120T00008750001.1